ncbi:MAG: TRAP transporter substrate-binding protein [Cyclobacteriaceae bacterium]|nr:TRAP transporter substrate-binding protein [Cyclobacteriaceae bacterium HetDA_MAG_MS6]
MRHAAHYLFAFLVLALAGCNQKTGRNTLKLAHGLDVTHSVHIAMEYMAERLEEYSGGELALEIYPNSQLGSERECLELLQIGALDMTKTSAASAENFAPAMKILSLPYLYENDEHEKAVLEGDIGLEMLRSATDFYLRGLCYYDAGSRSFYTIDKQVLAPDDLDGMKIRVMNSVTAMKLVRTLGGSATPISWGELYTALQQGVVDGAENNPPSFYLSKHYEVCKYYTLNEHTSIPDILLVSEHTWKRLSAEQQSWVQKAASESAIHQRDLWEKSEKEALQAVQDAGVTVVRPNKDLFSGKAKKLHEELIDTPELKSIYEKIQDAKSG